MSEDREIDRRIAHVMQCHQPTWSQQEEWLAHIYQNLLKIEAVLSWFLIW